VLRVGDWVYHRYHGATEVWVLANEAQADSARRLLKPSHILEVRRAPRWRRLLCALHIHGPSRIYSSHTDICEWCGDTWTT